MHESRRWCDMRLSVWNIIWTDSNASQLIWPLVWRIQMLWIFSFHMLLLLLQGMVGIVLIGACRENESSCNLTSLSGREWIRLIEHQSKWEHEFYRSLRLSFPVTQTLPNTLRHTDNQLTRRASYWSGYLLPASLAMAFQLREEERRKKRIWEQNCNIDEAQLSSQRKFFYRIQCSELVHPRCLKNCISSVLYTKSKN